MTHCLELATDAVETKQWPLQCLLKTFQSNKIISTTLFHAILLRFCKQIPEICTTCVMYLYQKSAYMNVWNCVTIDCLHSHFVMTCFMSYANAL